MIDLQRILVPCDFSETSRTAVRYGSEFANRFGAELHLLHVAEMPIAYGELAGYYPSLPEMVAAGNVELGKLKVDPPELEVTRTVVEGAPFVEIIRYARENAIDLIVMGTHGRGAIAHLLLGNVAERVVRKAQCPVLVVRPDEHDFVVP